VFTTRTFVRTVTYTACIVGLIGSACAVNAQDRTVPPPRYIPPGYVPDGNMYWAPSGRPPEVLRPIPPGYVVGPCGELIFAPPPKFPRPIPVWMDNYQQDRQSYHMYMRGYGPAIHSRPVGTFW
jgi:hypothetical protein